VTGSILASALVYIAIVIGIGIWSFSRTKTAADFYIAGKALGLVVISLTTMSTIMSGFTFVGGPGLQYQLGMVSLWILLPAPLTNTMTCWLLGKRLRMLAEKHEVFTIPDAIAIRFGSRLASGLAAAAILIGSIGYLATQVQALGVVIASIFYIGIVPAALIGVAIILFYSVAGGMIAGAYNDVFQGIVMVFASVTIFIFAIASAPGLPAMLHTIKAADPLYLHPWGKSSLFTALGWFFLFSFGVLGQPHIINKFFMIKDLKVLKWMPVLVTITTIMCGLIWFGIGVSVKYRVVAGLMPPLERPDQASSVFLLNYTPGILAGITFAGIMAAIMSTAIAFINIGSAALVRDIPLSFGRNLADQLLWGRFAVVAICAIATAVSLLTTRLVALQGVFGWGSFAAALAPVMAIGFNWKGATRAAAIASISTGMLVNAVLELFAPSRRWLPEGVLPPMVSLLVSFIVFIGVSFAGRKK
jgi:Na+/proline symporter